MTEIRTRVFVRIVGVAITALSSIGCGSNNNSSGAVGTTQTGGSGGGGAGAAKGCTAANMSTASADGLIADFMAGGGAPDAGGIEIMGGIVTYGGGTVGGTGSPTYTTTGGALNITETAAATSTVQYVGVVVYFNNCIDASAFMGVEFTISGSFSGCTMQYSTADSAHDDSTLSTPNPHATGPTGSYSPQAQLTATRVTSTPMTISMPFNGTGAPSGGSPDGLALDTAKLDSVSWQFTIPAAAPGVTGTPMCVANLAVDNIKFYR